MIRAGLSRALDGTLLALAWGVSLPAWLVLSAYQASTDAAGDLDVFLEEARRTYLEQVELDRRREDS